MALGQSVSSNRGLVEAGPPFLKVKFMLICSLIYRQISNFAIMKPQIAIITGNTLEAIGLESIVRKMMPKADVLLLPSFSALDQSAGFFHFFISSETLLSHAQFFLQRKQQTIVLMHGEETLPLQGSVRLMCGSRRMYFCAAYSKWRRRGINVGRDPCWKHKAKCSEPRR